MPFRPTPNTQAERDAQAERIKKIMAAKARNLDFTNVKERNFNIKHLPEGDYPAKVTKVEEVRNNADTEDMWLFTIALTGGGAGAKGVSLPYYCVLNANNYWKVRSLFVATGMNVPKKRLSVDPNKAVGKALGVTLEDDEYEGKMKSVISATIPLSEIDDTPDASPDDEDLGDEDEVKDTATKGGGKKKDKKGKKSKPAAATDDSELEEIEVDEL